MRSDAAGGLRGTDIRSAAVVGGKYCSVEKPDLAIAPNAVAENFVENRLSEDSLPLRPGAAGEMARPGM